MSIIVRVWVLAHAELCRLAYGLSRINFQPTVQ